MPFESMVSMPSRPRTVPQTHPEVNEQMVARMASCGTTLVEKLLGNKRPVTLSRAA